MTRTRHVVAVAIWALMGTGTQAQAAGKKQSERQLRAEAIAQHAAAKDLGDEAATAAYAKAEEAYAAYFARHAASKHRYDMHFAYAELLFKVEKYDAAYTEHMKVVEIDPDGERSKFSAESAVFAADKMIAREHAAEKAAADGSGKEKTSATLTDWETNLVTACDQFASVYKDDEKAGSFIYKSAFVFFQKGLFTDATQRFRSVINMAPESTEATHAAHLILDSYSQTGDWKGLSDAAKSFSDQEGFGDSEFKSQMQSIYERASFKLVEDTFSKDEDPAKAANGYMAFYGTFGESDLAALALSNAAVYFQVSGDDQTAIEKSTEFTDKFPDSDFFVRQLHLRATSQTTLGNAAQANALYAQACGREPADAEWSLKSCCALVKAHTEGLGVPVDANKAATWAKKAEALGDATCP